MMRQILLHPLALACHPLLLSSDLMVRSKKATNLNIFQPTESLSGYKVLQSHCVRSITPTLHISGRLASSFNIIQSLIQVVGCSGIKYMACLFA